MYFNYFICFNMSLSKSKVQERKYIIKVMREKYIRYKFYNQRCSRWVNRHKHHFAETRHGMKPYIYQS